MGNKIQWAGPVLSLFFLFWGCSGEKKESSQEKRPAPAQTRAENKSEGYHSVSVSDGGTIVGKVVFNGQGSTVPMTVSKDQEVCGKSQQDPSLILGAQGGVKNAVIRITNIRKGKRMGTERPVLDQNGCKFEPHLLAFPVGTTLEILNSDGILHNVHSFSVTNTPFNKAQPKFRKKITQTFTKAELISLKCDVHSWMSAWVFVFDHPYFDVTSDRGTFKLPDVPPGKYSLEIWHEKLGKQTKSIVVKPSDRVEINFEFSQPAS